MDGLVDEKVARSNPDKSLFIRIRSPGWTTVDTSTSSRSNIKCACFGLEVGDGWTLLIKGFSGLSISSFRSGLEGCWVKLGPAVLWLSGELVIGELGVQLFK